MTTKRDELRERIGKILLDFAHKDYMRGVMRVGTTKDLVPEYSDEIMTAIDSYVLEEKKESFIDGREATIKIMHSKANFHKELKNIKVPSPYSIDNNGTEEADQA